MQGARHHAGKQKYTRAPAAALTLQGVGRSTKPDSQAGWAPCAIIPQRTPEFILAGDGFFKSDLFPAGLSVQNACLKSEKVLIYDAHIYLFME